MGRAKVMEMCVHCLSLLPRYCGNAPRLCGEIEYTQIPARMSGAWRLTKIAALALRGQLHTQLPKLTTHGALRSRAYSTK
jgi:hypothetical protein